MATLPALQGHPTLVNWAKAYNPLGQPYRVAQLLSQANEIMQYMTWKEGNLATGHKDAVEVGLPTSTLRRFYQGVAPSKGDTAIIEDVCAMREMRSEVDKTLAELNGDVSKFRASHSMRFMESMTQAIASDLIYADTSTNKDGILGLTPRYNSLSVANNTSNNIIDSGGTGANNTSVWLVVFGDETISGIYPKGSTAGIQYEDLGIYDAFDANNARYRAYGEWWQIQYGLSVKDWRYAVRIANINVTDLRGRINTQANNVSTSLLYTMIDAMERIPSMGMGTPVFLASRLVKSRLAMMALDKSQNALGFQAALDQFGHVGPGSFAGNGDNIRGGQLTFQGVPILTVDKILPTEARVV